MIVDTVYCYCSEPAMLRASNKRENPGRHFLGCRKNGVSFFFFLRKLHLMSFFVISTSQMQHGTIIYAVIEHFNLHFTNTTMYILLIINFSLLSLSHSRHYSSLVSLSISTLSSVNQTLGASSLLCVSILLLCLFLFRNLHLVPIF